MFTLFSVLVTPFLFLMVGAFAGSPALTHIGGYLGLLTAFVACHASFAGVLNGTAKRVIMPTWPR